MDESAKATLDAKHLQKLAQDASLEAAESLSVDYSGLLPRFVEQIVLAARVRDSALMLDASLRLKTKFWLVGALRMNHLCNELELALALADWAAATALAREMELHLPRLQKALADIPYLALRNRRPRTLQAALAS